jgi:septal ring factor EnvC (AmiA/AmiB activator)
MLWELMLLAAFCIFAVFAALKVTEVEDRASRYRDQRDDCREAIEILQGWREADEDYVSRLWEEVDVRRQQVAALEDQVVAAERENQELRGRLGAYWTTSN